MAYAILFLSILFVPAALCAAIWTMDFRVFLIFLVALANAGFWIAVMNTVSERTK